MGRVVSPTPTPLSSGRVVPALVASYDMHGRAVGLFYTQPTGQKFDKTHKKVVFFSDALSALDALQNPTKKELNNLTSILPQLNDPVEVTLQWIPTHCKVHGNESTDILAKEGSGLDQQDKSVSYKDEKTIIKSLTARKWHQKHPDFNHTDGYHYLDRAD